MLSRTKRTVWWILVTVAIGLLCSPGALAKKPPKPPGDGDDEGPSAAEENPAIAFVTDTKGRQDVVVAAADLASEIVLTQTIQSKKKGRYTHLFGSPAWSPDGSMVAFAALDLTDPDVGREQLYVASADGSQVWLVRDFRSWPSLHRLNHTGGLSWSPEGREIVYEGHHAIVAIDVASGEISVLLDGFYTDDPHGQPVLSPDLDDAPGYQGMVAVCGRDGTFDAWGTARCDIFVAPIATDAEGNLSQIDPGLIVNVTNAPGTSESHPSWSPDGQALACFHDDGSRDDGTDEWLAVIDMSTGLSSLIWPDYGTSGQGSDRAAWTSDGLDLIYKTDFSGIDFGDLTIIAADGSGGPTNYTNTSDRREAAPAWNSQWDPTGPGSF
jgi:Tol biopolymer transport system component